VVRLIVRRDDTVVFQLANRCSMALIA